MKLKLDANLGTRGQRVLACTHHDVATAAEQSLSCATDETLISVCASEGRVLVTLDTDFANPLRYPPAQYAGIVVLRMLPRATTDDIEAALNAMLAVVGAESLAGRLIVVDQGGRVREYSPASD